MKLIKVSDRKQVSLGHLAQHDYYYAAILSDGRIVLTPVDLVPMKRKVDDEQR